ncbi:MAG: hypothetical protein ABIG61_04165 [Planctomycetota bacterium]
MAISSFIKQQTKDLPVEFELRPTQGDGFKIVQQGESFKVTGNNERSCLWGLYHIQAGGNEGTYTPRFQIRGTNPCETLARHSSEQIESFIDRMAHWWMNTIIIHICYGYKFHENKIERMCAERGIDIKYYVQTSLMFLSEAQSSVFACDKNGNPRTKQLENETRLCVSNPAALEAFRAGARRFFSSDNVRPGSAYILMDADGYLFCQCPKCRNIAPSEQWMRLLNIALEEADRSGKNLSIEYLSYVWRYKLPENFSTFDKVSGVMFDTHQRFRWKALNEPHVITIYSDFEAEVDLRAKGVPLNCYLYERLKQWRQAYSNKLYIFENLMLQGSISCPQPYTPQLLTDLDLYEDLGIDGVIYEAFEPGIESFTRQIGVLSRAMWSEQQSYEPTKLDQLCAGLSENEADFDFKNRFDVLEYLTTDKFDALAALRQSGYDSLLCEYAARLRVFLNDRTFEHFCEVVTFVNQHRKRFDWMYIAFNLARAIPPERKPWNDAAESVRQFLEVDKIHDLMEQMSEPLEETARIIDSLIKTD